LVKKEKRKEIDKSVVLYLLVLSENLRFGFIKLRISGMIVKTFFYFVARNRKKHFIIVCQESWGGNKKCLNLNGLLKFKRKERAQYENT